MGRKRKEKEEGGEGGREKVGKRWCEIDGSDELKNTSNFQKWVLPGVHTLNMHTNFHDMSLYALSPLQH